ncbi:MAG: PDZ domain-containing protein, partial [Deltaproteobacteria bacterium]|nr:PDZ domain-containing protein [Deltaproteobacteria bacterium]
MKKEGKLCPQNFQVWVAFLMGMVVIIIAIVVFDHVSVRGRVGTDTARMGEDEGVVYQGERDAQTSSAALSYTSGTEGRPRAWLGIEPVDITEGMAKQMGLKISGGVLINRVIQASPAEREGLLQGDIIYELDHRKVENSEELRRLLGKTDPGERVRIALFRDSKRKVSYIKLGESVSSGPTSSVSQIAGEIIPNDLRWGIVVSELTESLRSVYDIPGKDNGVLILMVAPGSAADKAGLIKGDVIRQVDETRIDNLADFFAAIGPSDKRSLLLNICRQGTQFYVNIAAVSAFMPVGGPSGSEEEDSTESDGYQGMPSVIPPRGKPEVQ